MIRITPHTKALLPQIDAVIFDIDGVLLDVSKSIRAVNCLAVPAYLRNLPNWNAPDDLLTSDEIECFKEAGGFNDDWDLTYAGVLLYLWKAARYKTRDAVILHALTPTITEYTDAIAERGGWLRGAQAFLSDMSQAGEWAQTQEGYDPARIRRIFQELWAGDNCRRLYGFEPETYTSPGKTVLDRPLLDSSLVPKNLLLAALTGRTRAEAAFGLEKVGLGERIRYPEHVMTKDDGNAKPDPSGMARLIAALGCRTALYIGDTVDDMRTVLNYRKLPASEGVTVLSGQVLTGTVGPDAESLFAEADIIAPDVNEILKLLEAAPFG